MNVCTGGGIAGVLCSLVQAEAAGFRPKSETEPLGLGLGSAVGNGSGVRWEEVVGCGVCGGCSGLCDCSMAQAGGRCLELTTRNRASVTRFRVFHVKKQWWQVAGGSGVVRARQRQLQGNAFTNAKWGRGLGPKTQTELPWLGFGFAVSNGGGERWWEVVGWLVRCNRGRGAARLQIRGGGAGWGPKT